MALVSKLFSKLTHPLVYTMSSEEKPLTTVYSSSAKLNNYSDVNT